MLVVDLMRYRWRDYWLLC